MKALKAAEPAMEMPRIEVVQQALYDSTQAKRTYMLYLVVFAIVGLLLSAIGIYGVLAYSVARRTREIGIRIAIGAQRRQVLGMVMGQGARLVTSGIAVGLLAAFWLTRLLQRRVSRQRNSRPYILGRRKSNGGCPAMNGASKPYGIVGEFTTAASVLHAAEKVRDAGFRKWDVFTPFPVHGMDRAMNRSEP
jgi:uncharacterized membrane protein YedE/YeeE